MISYDFVPISSQKGVLFFETPGRIPNVTQLNLSYEYVKILLRKQLRFHDHLL